MQPRPNTLLFGLVGSHAYGLAHEQSDKDYVGVYATPTQNLLGLDLPNLEKAVETKNPDTKYYEALHFCRLAMKSNPSILEAMWLDNYESLSSHGQILINIRHAFPTAKLVKAAYLGYANEQYGKLLKDSRKEKRAKNARHFARLLWQGSRLYITGRLQVKLSNPDYFVEFGEKVASGNLDRVKTEMLRAEQMFSNTSALPDQPNKELINEWLIGVRNGF